MSKLDTTRRSIITEQTVMLMPMPNQTLIRKHAFPVRIILDHVNPADPQEVHTYESRTIDLDLQVPGTYRDFVTQCKFKTQVTFGLLRYQAICIQHSLEIQTKAEDAKTTPTTHQEFAITRENWPDIQRHLIENHVCKFKLTAQTNREPWSIDYDSDSELVCVPGGFQSRPRPSLRPSHYCQQQSPRARRKNPHGSDKKKKQKFGPPWTEAEMVLIQEARSDKDKAKRADIDGSGSLNVRSPIAKTQGKMSWSQEFLHLCGGRRRPQREKARL